MRRAILGFRERPTWLVTGGLGFIGSHFIRAVLRDRPNVSIVNYDVMNYAANMANVADVAGESRYRFVRGDICDQSAVEAALGSGVDAIVNFAAETHVDRSILDPGGFLRTDVIGTHVLLESTRRFGVSRFLQVSTDEVYGHVAFGDSKEGDILAPRSPYAASKAGGDLQVLAYAATYGTPVLITRGSNTYGPNQYPEKLIPLFVTNLLEGRAVPLYGDGLQIRDWLHVDDHVSGILRVLEHGETGHVYNLGAGNPRTNIEITRSVLDLCNRSFERYVEHVVDRAGHDRRYALDSSKARALGWKPTREFTTGLVETVEWYRSNEAWWRPLKGATYSEYYRRQYVERGAP